MLHYQIEPQPVMIHLEVGQDHVRPVPRPLAVDRLGNVFEHEVQRQAGGNIDTEVHVLTDHRVDLVVLPVNQGARVALEFAGVQKAQDAVHEKPSIACSKPPSASCPTQ